MGYYVNSFHTLHTASVDCGHPGNVTNGTVVVSEGTKLRATAKYTCDEGFIPNGTQSRTCGSDGRWSGTTPICAGETLSLLKIPHTCMLVMLTVIKCNASQLEMLCNHAVLKTCPQPDIEHGSVKVTRFSTTNFVDYTCDVGYEMRGWRHRDCDLFTGEWDRPAPTCEECKLFKCSPQVYLQGIT